MVGHSILFQKPAVLAPIPIPFFPMSLGNRAYQQAVARTSQRATVEVALERNQGYVSRHQTEILLSGPTADTLLYLDRWLKSLLWQIGGWRIWLSAPDEIGAELQRRYSATGERAFDTQLMEQSYDQKFRFERVSAAQLPPAKECSTILGGHLDGCRIGFDLGASDYKLSAVQDGKVLFTTEIPWDPRVQPDPEWHYQKIQEGLKLAASHLPRVDAIGGSSAGIILDNEVRVASLFRSVPLALFRAKARTLFKRLQREWNVPLEVANDGDVTALAGGMSLGLKGILGVAMGSSLAAGWLDGSGRILGWLNELAFAPVDYHPDAPIDEWSKDRGCGVQFFSQQAVIRLANVIGITLPPGHPAEQLKHVQELLQKGDARAAQIFESVGVYYGYAVAQYADFYGLEHVLTLGRVTSGAGGDLLLDQARRVLKTEFPELAARISLHIPDEKSKRHGQAVAAASLPLLNSKS
ncbi:MAG: ROK family protein [Verrucomicrobiales bacterium]|nr:ROK family protein [Verrucomicrobiales bacterium]